MDAKEAQAFLAELDRLGEDEVNQRLAREAYEPSTIPLVREWLLRRVEDRAREQQSRLGGREGHQ